MRRQNVIALGYGADVELIENLKSLEKRYTSSKDGTYKGNKCSFYSVRRDNGGDYVDGQQDVEDEMIDEILGEGGDTGVYVICHGGGNGMKNPSPEVAAHQVAELLRSGVAINKISIGACQGAGALQDGELNDQKFAKSALSAFCKALGKERGNKLPKDLKICAYNINITTFDADSAWVKEKEGDDKRPTKRGPGLDNDTIRTAQLNYAPRGSIPRGENSLESMEAIRPQLKKSGLADLFKGHHRKIINDQWANNPNFKKYKETYGSFEEAIEKCPEMITNGIAAKFDRIVNNKLMSTLRDGDAELMTHLKNYIKNKVVMVHAREGQFRIGSLSEYSDTQEVQETVAAAEATMRPGNVPCVALNFHPDVAAEDTN